MSVQAVHNAITVVPLGMQARNKEDAKRILKELLEKNATGKLENPLEDAQLRKLEQDLKRISKLWATLYGQQTIKLWISFARRHGIV
ncbi:hypothetical protein KKF64_02870 [Patescibacteria group bacterium]|nr:hypothetical protein [Patescibacteria group bacterium]